jgi:hypothetical protein
MSAQQTEQETIYEGGYHRRVTDVQQEKIDELIAEEPDNKVRLTLMVMSNINKSIAANTDLTHAIHKEVKTLKYDLETHVAETLATKNQALGASRILKVAGPVLWSIMAAAVATMYHHYDNFQVDTTATLTTINAKLGNIETRMTFYGLSETQLTKGVPERKIPPPDNK